MNKSDLTIHRMKGCVFDTQVDVFTQECSACGRQRRVGAMVESLDGESLLLPEDLSSWEKISEICNDRYCRTNQPIKRLFLKPKAVYELKKAFQQQMRYSVPTQLSQSELMINNPITGEPIRIFFIDREVEHEVFVNHTLFGKPIRSIYDHSVL